MNKISIITVLILSTLLAGCPAVIATGAVAGLAAWHDRRTTGTMLDDNGIEYKIAQAIKADEELNYATHLNAISYNNVVLIVGQTPSEEFKNRVEDIVRNVPKVRSIYNELKVTGVTSIMVRSADSLTTAKVKKDMVMAKGLDPSRIKVITEDGIVYLLGIVSEKEDAIAGAVARRVKGVKKVVKIFERL